MDDGKSTLIGRLLYDSKMIFEDQLAALEADSKKVGTQGGEIDFALLVDGLAAEREQGITIDVAYRFFSTDKRKFIVADTPGHEQYTRNMVTGASTADAAVILIDARKGVLTQTRRHSYLVSLLGIRHVILAINKMDLVDWSQETFDDHPGRVPRLRRPRSASPSFHRHPDVGAARRQHHQPSDAALVFRPAADELLEDLPVEDDLREKPFRMPVQWVNRPNLDFRGFSGFISSGTIRPGDRIKVLPSSRESTVDRIVTFTGDLDRGRGRPVGDPHPDGRDRRLARRCAGQGRRPRPRSPTSSRPRWCGWTKSPCCRAGPICLKLGTRTVGASGRRAEIQGQRQHPGEAGRASGWS